MKDFPRIPLTQHINIWLNSAYVRLREGQPTKPTEMLVELWSSLSDDFDYKSIDSRLMRFGVELTLLGILHVDPATDLVEKTDHVIRFIRELITKQPAIEAVSSEQISRDLMIPEQDVAVIFGLINHLGDFWNGGAGYGDKPGYYAVTIRDEKVKREYLKYRGIDELLERLGANEPTVMERSHDNRQYDVCLSFAGEDRDYVARVAATLRAAGVSLFYDKYEHASLWGKDLYQHLDDIYRKRATYCVVFISSAYAQKLWTKHELKSAQARAFDENREYILPVRLDDAQLPGILPATGYVSDKEPEELAALIVEKLTQTERSTSIAPTDTAQGIAPRRFGSGVGTVGPTAILEGSQGHLEDDKPIAGTANELGAVRELGEPRLLIYRGSGIVSAASCLQNTADARLQWQVSRRLALELRRGRSSTNLRAVEAWAGPPLTAWVTNGELFLSTLPSLEHSFSATPPIRLRVFVFAIEDDGIRLTRTIEFDGPEWQPIQLSAYRQRFHGCYLDRPGADPYREAILQMLNEAGSRIKSPAVFNECQIVRFGSFMQPQETHPSSDDWDIDPLLVDPRIDEFTYAQSPSGHRIGLIRVQGSWSADAISTLNRCMWTLLRRRALLVNYCWGVTRLVVAEPETVRNRIAACLQSCIDRQFPVPWRPNLDPLTIASTNEWLEPLSSVALPDKEWADFNDRVCLPLVKVELPSTEDDDGWFLKDRHAYSLDSEPTLIEDKLHWGP